MTDRKITTAAAHGLGEQQHLWIMLCIDLDAIRYEDAHSGFTLSISTERYILWCRCDISGLFHIKSSLGLTTACVVGRTHCLSWKKGASHSTSIHLTNMSRVEEKVHHQHHPLGS